jgi:hypothetical protein
MSATTVLLLTLLLGGRLPAAPLPHVPAGPSAGDHGEGWAVSLDAIAPQAGVGIPWLRSATSARLFVHELPAEAEAARPRLVEAAAMILARHGRRFEQPAWDDWFRKSDWYQPRVDYSPALLSEGEREALDRLVQAWHRLSPGGPTRP